MPQEQRMELKTIDQLSLAHKRVLIRVDFNVPLTRGQKASEQKVSDATRVREALPTIQHVLARGATVLLASHLGRPRGTVTPALSLKPVAALLQELLGRPVQLAPDCVGAAVQHQVSQLPAGVVIVLENLRFHAEEEANDPAFSRALADLADIYVNDAFGSSHRSHASVVGVVQHFEDKGAGFLVRREVEALSSLLSTPDRPFVAILGGAKVSDKIGLIHSLLPRADAIIIGGAMAYTLLRARGVKTGRSLVEPEKIDEARNVLQQAQHLGVSIHLPQDHIVTAELSAGAAAIATTGADIPDTQLGVDIGPHSIAAFRAVVQSARTILWNGPMGVFEMSPYDRGTRSIAEAVASLSSCFSVAGGGDTVAALSQAGLTDRISHISTGGGASLAFLESGDLPGLAALRS